MAQSLPSRKELRLPAPLGGPHKLFDGSFIIEFLQVPPGLDATVLMRATYVGGHDATKLGKAHPQTPPLHIHFHQAESFIVESGAIGTTTTYDVIDTIHTTTRAYPQKPPRPGLSPPLPSRTANGVTVIPPYTPHTFWPVSPDHPFWSTAQGRVYESQQPSGRNSDTTLLIWGHPKTRNDPAKGTLTTDFPPDMDAAFFLALLSLVDALHGQRLNMSPSLGATLMAMQTASGASLLVAPTAWWLGPLRWAIPWSGQVVMEWIRRVFDGKSPTQVVEETIEREVVRKR
ncbi:hypothetical protein ARAM_001572 [Aspergillus rambellii]|uniref:Uncharacterized protein n=1 Tax=Aspergillus rambellii TaxID=308745 RepID=A0A0F8V3H4_9EURO|nr:hypothetical protein ARAM_001572 [Aspergillus rambellii]